MFILGTIVAGGLAFALLALAGPAGGYVFVSIVFGLVFATYWRVKNIQQELRLIKEKLGIGEAINRPLTNEEIEQDLEAELERNGDPSSDPNDSNDPNDPGASTDPNEPTDPDDSHDESDGKPSRRQR